MNILITGSLQASQVDIDRIESLGHTVTVHSDERVLVECPEKYEGVICNGLFIYNSIEKFSNLRYIQLTSAGYDRVPIEYIKSHGIEIYNARGVYSIPMAEFAICGVLQLYKQSRFFSFNQNKTEWKKNRNLMELSGKIVCIVGCGSVGTECAKRFKAFGCTVLGIDLFPYVSSDYTKILGMDNLNKILKISDVIVLTVPLTGTTCHLIDVSRLRLFKKNAVLVNIARGAIVDTKALIDFLPNIGGAVLDVFENEPLDKTSPLWSLDNVIISPHNSFVGELNHHRLMNIVIERLSTFYI